MVSLSAPSWPISLLWTFVLRLKSLSGIITTRSHHLRPRPWWKTGVKWTDFARNEPGATRGNVRASGSAYPPHLTPPVSPGAPRSGGPLPGADGGKCYLVLIVATHIKQESLALSPNTSQMTYMIRGIKRLFITIMLLTLKSISIKIILISARIIGGTPFYYGPSWKSVWSLMHHWKKRVYKYRLIKNYNPLSTD